MSDGFSLKFNEVAAEMVDRWTRVVSICFASFFLLFGCTLEQQLLNSRQERLALLQLRSSLGLRSREWPIRSDPCTLWAGIECANGRVTGIDISGFRRTRRGSQNPQFSVDALQNLTYLSSFNASNFRLPGPIPDWLGLQLNALQVLDLRSCSINGAIPFTLGNLTPIVELYLSNNNLTGVVPSNLAQLAHLSVLDLSRNLLTGPIPDSFANFRNLTVLDMSSNLLSGEIPEGIRTLSGLQFLNLSRNSLSSSIPAQLSNLANLIDLDLGFNSLSGPIPPNLSNLVNMQRLIIGNNFLSGQLTNNLFVSMVQLRFLVLNHNGFVGEFPNLLWSIPSLQFLDVSMNNFTGVLPEISSTAFNSSNTAVYNISKNLFYGNITSLIRNYGFIDMSGNYFQGPVPISGTTSLVDNCLRNVTNQRSLSECASFYSERNLVFDNFGQPNTTQQPAPPRSGKNNNRRRTVIILASVFGGVGLVALVVFIIMLLILCKRKRPPQNQRGISVGPVPLGGASPPPPPGEQLINFSNLGDGFTYNQILKATSEFNEANLIKNGHSGDLYHGILEGGLNVVIKRVNLGSSVKKETYVSELELFTKVSHTRLVPLLGHCLEKENAKFIVYKHMKNGDLSTSLFKKTNSDDSLQSLDWITRLKIAIGAAEGLSYLHHECNPPLVHRDVQASSILLDDKFEVRLGSLSEVCVQEGDTHQNRITRLLRLPQTSDQGASGTPNATCSYDVYCFGKVLLELVTGKLGISSSADTTMKEYLETTLPHISIYDKELVTNIVDPSLIIDEDLLEEVWAMAIVARSCLNPKANRRPLMRYILKALENPLKVVREEQYSSARLRATSSRASWNGNLFGSWRSSDVGPTQSHKIEDFQESGQIGDGNGNGNGHSTRRHSKEIFPEPLDE